MTLGQRRIDVMIKVRLLIGVIGAILVFLSVRSTTAQIDPRMPQGPNRELVARKCTSCHDVSNFIGTAGRSRAGWDTKIEDMVLYGMRITPEERALVLDYLATYLPP
jgi:hypothetical protein